KLTWCRQTPQLKSVAGTRGLSFQTFMLGARQDDPRRPVSLAWAHAEYIKLVQSAADQKVFDLIPDVADRYLPPHPRATLEFGNFYRPSDAVPAGSSLRILLAWPVRLRWSPDGWAHTTDTIATSALPGVHSVDLSLDATQPGLSSSPSSGRTSKPG